MKKLSGLFIKFIKNKLQIAAPLIVGLVIGLALCEVVLRILPLPIFQVNDPYKFTKINGEPQYGVPLNHYSEIYPLEFDSRNYYSKSEGVINYFNDEFGSRWIHSAKRSLRGQKILAVGDSFTHGFGLRYEDTMLYKTEQALPALSILNFAVPGADSIRALEVFETKKPLIAYSILLYGLHLNDLVYFKTSYAITNESLSHQLAKDYLTVAYLLQGWELLWNRSRKIREMNSNCSPKVEFFQKNFQAILSMNRIAKAENKKFFVVIYPVLVQLDQKPFQECFNKIQNLLNEAQIDFVEALPHPEYYSDQSLWITPYDQHPNEVAHEIFSKNLIAFLQSKIGIH